MKSKKGLTPIWVIVLSLSILCTALISVQAEQISDPNRSDFEAGNVNTAITTCKLPKSEDAELCFSAALKSPDDWATNLSDPVVYDGKIYAIAGDELFVLAEDGSVINRVQLPGLIGYNCKPMTTDEMLIIPLADADVLALHIKTLETIWHTAPVVTTDSTGKKQYHSIQSPMAFDGTDIYLATMFMDETYTPVRGELLCLNAQSGDIVWTYDNTDGGYLWDGMIVRNDKIVIAGSDAYISVLDAQNGQMLERKPLSSAANSSVVFADEHYYIVTKDGVLTQFTVAEDGAVTVCNAVDFAYSSTATPVICNGMIYVGGAFEATVDWTVPAAGVFVVIDANTMSVLNSVKTPAEVKSSALLCIADEPVAYFTCNAYPGAVYCCEAGAVHVVYTPQAELQNYCVSSPICFSDGKLLYGNDSGSLFMIGAKVREITTEEGVTASEEILKGDLNHDGKINSSDARIVLRISAKLDPAPENIVALADMTDDGKVNSADARILLRMAAHLQ